MDNFQHYIRGLESPIENAVAVVPNDATDLPFITRTLHIGTAGNLKVTTKSGAVVTYKNLPAGEKQGRFQRIWATGTTAADIVAEE